MAKSRFRPFMISCCCMAGLQAGAWLVCAAVAQAEPFDGHHSTSFSMVRPVAHIEADSVEVDSAEADETASGKTLPFFAPLLAQLQEVSQLGNTEVHRWAVETIAGVRDLAHAAEGSSAEVRVACDRLDRSVREAYMIASLGMSQNDADQLRRAGYAIQRRVAICRNLFPIDIFQHTPPMVPVDPERLPKAVRAVEKLLATDPAGKTWRKFLMLDELNELPELNADASTHNKKGLDDGKSLAQYEYKKGPGGVTQRRAVVRKALASASDVWLNDQQKAFLARPELQELGAALRAEAAGPASAKEILTIIERYETLGLQSAAKQLADETMWLSLTGNEQRQALRQELTNHYRNANFRIEVAEVLMDRLIPPRTPELAPVRDTVLGRPVRGESLTETKVGIELIPNEDRLTLAIDVAGEVDASTLSTSGPATFRNRSYSWYHAQKPLEITTSGIKIMPTEVLEVRNMTRLRSLRTSLDGVPLLGSLVNDVARSQHDMKQGEMREEIRRKVKARAKSKIETEANERLGLMAKRFEENILGPLDRLSLGPTMVQAKTTDDRLVMRVRLASIRQLGAHTARPKAPDDSLLSFQVHESAMNNAIERLKLDGRTFTVLEIRQKLAKMLKKPELAEASSKHDDATITFAAQDAIRVKMDEGKLRFNLSIGELRKGSKAWHDFEVIVFYTPISDGLATHLARDGVVQLDAGRISFRSQMTLRGVFCTVFSKNRTIPLLPPKVAEHPKLADLQLSQLELNSGWLAVALSSNEKSIAHQPEVDELR